MSEVALRQAALRSPRSAAYAGIVFSLLLAVSLVTMYAAVPHEPADNPELLTGSLRRELLLTGLSVVPFAAVAFLWFVGVIRDWVGEREDRFFSTVFFGSGVLFVAMLLIGEALAAAMVLSIPADADTLSASSLDWWTATRNVCLQLLEASLQMAGVFTTATSALLRRSRVGPRWLTVSGSVISVLLFFAVFFSRWIGLLFPLWVFALSVNILVVARRGELAAGTPSGA
jgi:hypothetical protein